MTEERRRALRHPLIASAEIIELLTDTHIQARTSDLSLVGCYFDMLNPLPLGTSVKLRITHEATTFTALGTVTHSEPNMGMGIGFTHVEPDQLKVLEQWLGIGSE
jgi:hypothetical protein